MDLGNIVSPDWLIRSKAFTSKLPREWSAVQEKDPSVLATTNSELASILGIALHGRFLSILLFDKRLSLFLDAFLNNRTRLDVNGLPDLDELDVSVFELFAKFVRGRATTPTFSPTSEVRSFDEALASFFTPIRLIQLGALYHEPSVQSGDAFCALIAESLRGRPRLPRDVLTYLERAAVSSARLGLRMAAGMRALLVDARLGYLNPDDHVVGGRITMLGHSDVGAALSALTQAYELAPSGDASDPTLEEKAHILSLLECVLLGMREPSSLEANMETVLQLLTSSEEVPLIWRDFGLTRKSFFADEFRSLVSAKDMFETQLEYFTTVLDAATPSERLPSLPSAGVSQQPDSPEPTRALDAPAASAPAAEDPNLVTLRELAPHLNEQFCQRLLAAVDGSLERAVTCVFEERFPPGLSPDDAPGAAAAAPPPPAASQEPQPLRRSAQVEQDFNNVALDDAEVRMRILGLDSSGADYDLYEDEDDELEERGATGVDARAAEEREVFIDPNDGTRRDIHGKLVTEEEMEVLERQNMLRRPNTNRERAPPVDSSRKREPRGRQGPKPELTPQQLQERVKRERARKEQSGSYARQKGAAKKAARTNPGP